MRVFEPGVRIEAPPPGLPSGPVNAPRWTIGLAGGVVIALGLAWIILRAVRRASKK